MSRRKARQERKATVERKRGQWHEAEAPDDKRFDGDIPQDEYEGADKHARDAQEFRS